GPGDDIEALANVETLAEPAGAEQVLGRGQLPGRLLAVQHALVPHRVELEARAGDPVRALDHEAAGRRLDPQAVAGVPLTVGVAPRAQRLDHQLHRAAGEQR